MLPPGRSAALRRRACGILIPDIAPSHETNPDRIIGSLHAKNVPVIINISVQPESSVGQITVCRMRQPKKETFRKNLFIVTSLSLSRVCGNEFPGHSSANRFTRFSGGVRLGGTLLPA
jgi:hypothetical protein